MPLNGSPARRSNRNRMAAARRSNYKCPQAVSGSSSSGEHIALSGRAGPTANPLKQPITFPKGTVCTEVLDMSRKISRRQMIGGAAAAWASVMVVPRHVLGLGQVPPSEIIRVAGIGVGGQGAGDINAVAQEKDVRIVALCDVDEWRGKESFEKYPEAARYKDFRKMIDDHQKDFDAVVVATPDHTHAAATLASIW